MQRIKNILNFYIFSNIHVALATFCLTKITLLEIGISENKTAWFVFFSTLVSYTIIRFIRVDKITSWFGKWFQVNKTYLYVIIGFGALGLLYFTFFLRFKAILILIPFVFVTLFYVVPIKKITLRTVAGLKLFLIAISWSGITVLFPIIQNYLSLRTVDYITFFQRFLFVVVITIPFDIRDLDYDRKELQTLPQQIGVRKSKFVGILFLLLFFFLEFFKSDYSSQSVMSLLIIMVVSSILLLKSDGHQSKYYSAFFVESIPILWYLLTIFIQV